MVAAAAAYACADIHANTIIVVLLYCHALIDCLPFCNKPTKASLMQCFTCGGYTSLILF